MRLRPLKTVVRTVNTASQLLRPPKVKVGGRPGALGNDADHHVQTPASFRVVDYSTEAVAQENYADVQQALAWAKSEQVTWLHVSGDITPSAMRALRDAYGLHPLAVEDVMNRGQRPKHEDYDGQLFMTLTMPEQTETGTVVNQLSLFLLPNDFVLSFYSGSQALFEPIRERIQEGKGLIRRAGADYLFYALVDVAVDVGFPLMEDYTERMETLEDAIFADRQQDPIAVIHSLKKELIALRKGLWAQSLMLTDLVRNSHPLISESVQPYFRDCEDHANKITDLLDSSRDMSSALLDTHLSLVSNRMNDIMKVLTLMSTVFIPLSFIVGLYGMNFDTASPYNLPELGWRFGYPFVWGVIATTVIGLMLYFRKKRWI